MSTPFLHTREDYLTSLRAFAKAHGIHRIEDCWEGPGVYYMSVFAPGTHPVAYAEKDKTVVYQTTN